MPCLRRVKVVAQDQHHRHGNAKLFTSFDTAPSISSWILGRNTWSIALFYRKGAADCSYSKWELTQGGILRMELRPIVWCIWEVHLILWLELTSYWKGKPWVGSILELSGMRLLLYLYLILGTIWPRMELNGLFNIYPHHSQFILKQYKLIIFCPWHCLCYWEENIELGLLGV